MNILISAGLAQVVDPLHRNSSDLVPIPDPTRLTIDALRREIDWLKLILEEKIDSLEALTMIKFAEKDLIYAHMQQLAQERNARISAIELQIISLTGRIVAVEAIRSGESSVLPWVMGIATLVVAAIGVLAVHWTLH